MKKSVTILAAVLITASVFAQAPQKMSYQAVIRNSSDQLVVNTQIGMQISILQGSSTGTPVYVETQTPTTNANGLVTIEIGGGIGFDTINWANGPYFIKTETDLTGGTNYTISGTSELLSVPYALNAKKAETADYNFLTNLPTLFNGQYSSLSGTPTLFDGNYNSLSNLPTLFDGQYSSLSGTPTLATVATTGSYTDLINQPTLFDGQYSSLSGTPTLATVATSGSYTDLINQPTLFDGQYSSLSGTPTLATVATSGSYTDLINQPTLFDGQYSSLTGAPINVSNFTNDVGYLTTFTEIDPKVGSNTTGYSPKWDGSALVTGAIYQDAAGKVGIGTTNPQTTLDITSTNTTDAVIRFKNFNDPIGGVMINTYDAVQFGMFNPSGSVVNQLPAGSGRSFFGFDPTGKVGSLTNYYLTNTYRNLLDDGSGNASFTGNVGIGTTTPGAKLEVAGQVKITGGAPAVGAVLTSDVTGLASWQPHVLNISNDTISLSNGGGFVNIPAQIPALISQDDFSYTAPLKNYWSSAITGGATITLTNSVVQLSTNGAGNTAKLYSNKQKSVTDGKLIFTGVISTYEDNNTAYGPLSRGLVNGTDRNNAIEFINVSGNTIQARTVSGGVATTTNYAVGASVYNYYSYTIIATKSKVEFYFDGNLIATHTTNIPTLPLNMYFDVSTWSGNVPQVIDDAKFEIIKY